MDHLDALHGKIMRRLSEEARLAVLRRKRLWSVGLVASTCAGAAAAYLLSVAAVQSGFTAYLSLLFTDGSTMLADGMELALAMVESFPVTYAMLAAASAWFALLSLREIAQETRTLAI